MEYYANISISIDSDEYFSVMMNNSWNLKGDTSTYQKYSKGWGNKDEDAKSTISSISQKNLGTEARSF